MKKLTEPCMQIGKQMSNCRYIETEVQAHTHTHMKMHRHKDL